MDDREAKCLHQGYWDELIQDCLEIKILATEDPRFPNPTTIMKSELQSLREFFETTDLQNVDPLNWWRDYSKFSHLGPFVRMFLEVPASSTPSERAFSDAGLVYNTRNPQLELDKVEKIVFIRENMKHLPKDPEEIMKLVLSCRQLPNEE